MTVSVPCTLADLAAEVGTEVPCTNSLQIMFDDSRYVWVVDTGAVDIFLVDTENGEDKSAPQPLLRAAEGRLLPGVTPSTGNTTLSFRARGLPGTVLRRLHASRLATVDPAEVAAQVELWVVELSATISRYVRHPPLPDALPRPGETVEVQGVLCARRGVVWVSRPLAGASLFMDLVDWADFDTGDGSIGAIPLTPTGWLRLNGQERMSARSSESLAQEGTLLSALEPFHAASLALERLNRQFFVADQANLARERASNRQGGEQSARHRLFDLYGVREGWELDAEETALTGALRIIGARQGIEFRVPTHSGAVGTPVGLDDILEASGVRARQVRLDQADTWWLGDNNPMLAFRAVDGRPVALLPGVFGRYREHDPVSGRSTRVTAQRAGALKAEAWLFYRPLPDDDKVGLAELARIAWQGSAVDILRLVLAGLPVGLITLLPALALGFVADRITGNGGFGEVYAVTAALAALGLLGAMLFMLQGTASMRLGGRAASRIEAAFWDRMLRLPYGALQRFPPGDLAVRAMALESLRQGAQGVVADALVSVVFLLPVFLVVLFHHATLGLVALVLGVASLLVTVVFGLLQMAPRNRVIDAYRQVGSGLFQSIGGISRLRAGSAEGLAFAAWARNYHEQKRAELALDAIQVHSRAFCAALPLLTTAGLVLAAVLADETILAGDFLIVFGVSMAFQTAVGRFAESFGMIAGLMPSLAQIRPLLSDMPERPAEGEPVDALNGDILFDGVSFRYHPDGPQILDDVTIRVRPGEFVAIAGESGAGKSTLFRLALGLDRPSSGAIYYDGRDLDRLNLKQLRRHVGSVPQKVRLHPQDLLDNIIGHREGVTNAEVWRASQMACVERDIRAMPMQMATPVGGATSVLSGGESQRIMIAHALIGNARVLLLDEATNWLDNEDQSRVMRNLANLTSTRIVIAHRLSTLREVDRIYVMRAGRVVQEGTFEDLTETDGPFQDLMRRQLI